MTGLISEVGGVLLKAAIALAVAACLYLAAAAHIAGAIKDAAMTARAERDAHWQGELDKANAAISAEAARQARQAMDTEAAANARIHAAEYRQIELEKDNAALPDADGCGLRRDRVRLLPR